MNCQNFNNECHVYNFGEMILIHFSLYSWKLLLINCICIHGLLLFFLFFSFLLLYYIIPYLLLQGCARILFYFICLCLLLGTWVEYTLDWNEILLSRLLWILLSAFFSHIQQKKLPQNPSDINICDKRNDILHICIIHIPYICILLYQGIFMKKSSVSYNNIFVVIVTLIKNHIKIWQF